MQDLTTLPSSEMLQKLLKVLLHFRAIDSEFPLQYAICLCEIAQNPAISLTQLSEKTNLALSTVSRIVGALSDYRPNGAPYGLVKMEVAPNERRRRELRLTEAGTALLANVCSPFTEDKLVGNSRPVSLKTAW